MGGIAGPELLVILLVALLVFGPKSIPGVARGVGKGMRELRRLTTEFQREINLAAADDETRIGVRRSPAPPAAPASPGPPDPPDGEAPSGDAPGDRPS